MFLIETKKGNKKFYKWREALNWGRQQGDPFAIKFRGIVVASWNAIDDFWYFIDPEYIVQNWEFYKRSSREPR